MIWIGFIVLGVYIGFLDYCLETRCDTIERKLDVIKWQLYEIDTRLRNNTTNNSNNTNNQSSCQTQTKQQ